MKIGDRHEAGMRLAEAVARLHLPAAVVVALGARSVPVAEPIATALAAPLDVLVVGSVRHPEDPDVELAAVTEDGTVVETGMFGPRGLELDRAQDAAEREAARCRGDSLPVEVRARDVVLVDEVVTCSRARVAARALRRRGAARVVVASPVVDRGTRTSLEGIVDDVVALSNPSDPRRSGRWCAELEPVAEADVVRILASARADAGRRPPLVRGVSVSVGGHDVLAEVVVPASTTGAVVLVNETRRELRGRLLAQVLAEAGLATVAAELWGPGARPDPDGLVELVRGLRDEPELHGLRLGLLAAGDAAPVAAAAAAVLGEEVAALALVDGVAPATAPQPTLRLPGDDGQTGAVEAEAGAIARWFAEHLAAALTG